ncbi:type 11 methyltransferase [Thermosipho africanus H17ap60334]|jgi:ubiquinone/menaquinone biosynthesis C-methylase UbiE|nr:MULTISPECIES: class I SAM-dependent methyltransferase [Thermosipho]EKF50101.1 type 11 methyltransferase [Thermosipho africanus H17ap60334]MBZ4650881.1 Methyltransferase type 11 [Thermosipho sp. (in: thermotogales)]RDI90240.1 type 11 methyltransferase [Thermosipho africanus Ob7]
MGGHQGNFSKIWNKVWIGNNTYSDEKVRDYVSRLKVKQIVEYIKREFKISNVGTIAEIGCGDGRILKLVGRDLNSKELIGIDISEKAIYKARKMFGNQMLLKLGSAVNVPIEDNYCDLVLSLGVIEHYRLKEDLEKSVKEIYRILKPGGIAVIMVPNRISFGVIDRIIQQIFGKWDYGYQKELTPKQLEKIIKKSGFSVIKYKITNLIVVPGVRKNFRFRVIRTFDTFLKKIVNDCGFYLYTYSKK